MKEPNRPIVKITCKESDGHARTFYAEESAVALVIDTLEDVGLYESICAEAAIASETTWNKIIAIG